MIPYIVAGVVILLTLWVLLGKGIGGGGGGGGKVALHPEKFQDFVLSEKIQVSHDSWIFRFALHTPTQRLGLPIGQHIYVRAKTTSPEGDTEVVQHPYTPISSNDDLGRVDFLIKVYHKNVHPKFPNGGRLSQHLYHLPLGATVEMRGPVGKFEYLGNGNYTVSDGKGGLKERHADAFAMVAGGTGITPMLQLMRAIINSPQDRTKMSLVFANQSEDDILLRKELDECAKDPRVKVWYTICNDVSPEWKYSTGFVTEDMLRANLPVLQPEDESSKKHGHVLALLCGPPPMLQFAVKPNLEKMGYTAENMFAF